VDFATSDDAAVYRQTDGSLIVATLDFFTPIVNNPRDFGGIAAANALSDIYAMGATPLFALNIIAFPEHELPLEILSEILQGGSEVAREAGIFVVGGHSIDDKEPKYGLVVIGRVEDESQLIRNDTVYDGDVLVLTKPVGTGILNTALKHGTVTDEELSDVIQSMKTLNRDAAELAIRHGVHAMTDVTGYGLLGHLWEMLESSGIYAEIDCDAVPVFDNVLSFIRQGEIPGGTRRNLKAVQKNVDFAGLDELHQILLADAQTSGGLLVSLPRETASTFVNEMHERGHKETGIIGRCHSRRTPGISIRHGE